MEFMDQAISSFSELFYFFAPSIKMIIRAWQIMKTNKILAILLISKSREPYFDLGFLELIFDLVSFPVYNTRPYTSP
jgi:hypothetical protein